MSQSEAGRRGKRFKSQRRYQRHGEPAAGSPQDLIQVAHLDVVPGNSPQLGRQLALQLQLSI